MSKLYKTYPIQIDDDFVWVVYENATEQVIDSFFFDDDAVEYMSFLERGGGFAGFTPSFMLREAPIYRNIDDAFAAEFA